MTTISEFVTLLLLAWYSCPIHHPIASSLHRLSPYISTLHFHTPTALPKGSKRGVWHFNPSLLIGDSGSLRLVILFLCSCIYLAYRLTSLSMQCMNDVLLPPSLLILCMAFKIPKNFDGEESYLDSNDAINVASKWQAGSTVKPLPSYSHFIENEKASSDI